MVSINAQQVPYNRLQQRIIRLPDDSADGFITDPPYYDAVPYSYLSDFFYVWFARAVGSIHSELLRGTSVPKDEEVVVDRPHELSNSTHDIAFYERELAKAFAEGRRVASTGRHWHDRIRQQDDGKLGSHSEGRCGCRLDYHRLLAHRHRTRGSRLSTRPSAARILRPSRLPTPRESRRRASHVPTSASGETCWTNSPIEFRTGCPGSTKEGVSGADAIFACLGPALEIFSRYSRVERADGTPVTLREYLEQVWAAVAKEALALVFEGADASGLEADARLTAMWLWTLRASSNGQAADRRPTSETDGESDEDD